MKLGAVTKDTTVTRGIMAVLDAADPKKADMSYELHGVFRLIPKVAAVLTDRPKLVESINSACARFKTSASEDAGLGGKLAYIAINSLSEADMAAEAERG